MHAYQSSAVMVKNTLTHLLIVFAKYASTLESGDNLIFPLTISVPKFICKGAAMVVN